MDDYPLPKMYVTPTSELGLAVSFLGDSFFINTIITIGLTYFNKRE